MDRFAAKANLEVAGSTEVEGPFGWTTVRIRRLGAWDGSPMWSHWVLLAPWYRLQLFVRGEKRWEVVTGKRGADARVLAVVNSKADAVERAIEVVERLSQGERA